MTTYIVKLIRHGKGYQTKVFADNQSQAYINARIKICNAKQLQNDEHLQNVSCVCEESKDDILNNDIFKQMFGGFKK